MSSKDAICGKSVPTTLFNRHSIEIIDMVKKKPNSKKTVEELTEKQKAFCYHYVICMNGVLAVKLAKYEALTDRSRATISSENLKKPAIRKLIEDIKSEAKENLMLEVEDLMRVLIEIGFSNIKDFIDDDGFLTKDIKHIPRSVMTAVREIKETQQFNKEGEVTSTTYMIKLNNNMEAVKIMLQKMGELKQGLEITIRSEKEAFDALEDINREINEIKRL